MYGSSNCLIVKLVSGHATRNSNMIYLEAVERAIRHIDLNKINEAVAKTDPIAKQHEGGVAALTCYPIADRIEL